MSARTQVISIRMEPEINDRLTILASKMGLDRSTTAYRLLHGILMSMVPEGPMYTLSNGEAYTVLPPDLREAVERRLSNVPDATEAENARWVKVAVPKEHQGTVHEYIRSTRGDVDE